MAPLISSIDVYITVIVLFVWTVVACLNLLVPRRFVMVESMFLTSSQYLAMVDTQFGLWLNLQVCEWRPPEQLKQLLDLEMRDSGEPPHRLLELCRDVIRYSVKTSKNFNLLPWSVPLTSSYVCKAFIYLSKLSIAIFVEWEIWIKKLVVLTFLQWSL